MLNESYAAALRCPNRATLQDVRLIDLLAHTDNRGWLAELLRCDSPHYAGFGQLYVVNNFQSIVVRAFHMHLAQDEFFFVTRGTIQFILVDERPESLTHGQLNCFVLTAERPQALYVPRGIQHGSMALSDGAQIIAVTNQPYRRESPDEIRFPADHYGPVWQIGGW
jgi:dTDP-4-dehydrorhamnose 3,5-epimerase